MRLIFLPDGWTVLICFLLWPIIQVAISWCCLKIPDRCYRADGFWFRTHPWEKGGLVYQTLFRVRVWKERLPDGGKAFRNGFQKKRLLDTSPAHIEKFLVESCRAELAHWLAILPFWIFGFIAPPIIIPMMLAYALIINVPCIIAQRFNRPRFQRQLARIRAQESQAQ
jgi:glycosyl-4,4'-diaponeurosporenoate acyltransferase